MKTVICPGSFDPVTVGHLDIIRRSAAMFDKVIVVAMTNYHKKNTYAFSAAERVALLKRCTRIFRTSRWMLTTGFWRNMRGKRTRRRLLRVCAPFRILNMNFSRR